MLSRRVVVTGIGLVSPLGIGTEANWDALCWRARAASARSRSSTRRRSRRRFAGEVKGFDPLQFIEKKDVKKMDVFIQYAVAASQFAMDDAKLTITPEMAPRVGVFIASGIGGFTTIEREHKALLEGGPRKISPFFIPAAIINLASGQVSIRFGAKGPNSATCTACYGVGARHRRRLRDHPARRRRRDDRRRLRGRDLRRWASAASPRCARCRTRNDEPRPGQPAVRQGSRRLRHRRGRRRPDSRRARVRAGAAARRSTPRWSATACPADAYHMTAPSEDGDGAVPRDAGGARVGRHRAGRRRLHQRPRHLDAVQRPARDAGDQAGVRRSRATSWRSRRPSR